MPLVECVPNYSEGRRPAVIAAIRDAIAATPGAHVLDVHVDAWHDRSVVTFVAPPESAVDAAFAGAERAAALIDLTGHHGVHPRLGAADVTPFVPLPQHGTTMDDCVALARRLGARVGRELGLPVYLYERAATRADRVNLADVRRGGFERLRELAGRDPARLPDFGPPAPHPTAGAAAVGARGFLVAYNVYLGGTEHMDVARAVARAVRASSGGLPAVKALALAVDGQAQVSMNLVDVDVTSVAAAYARVEAEARARGAEPTWSELVGLAPERTLDADVARRVRLRDFGPHRLLERRLRDPRIPASGRTTRLTDGRARSGRSCGGPVSRVRGRGRRVPPAGV
jgi:glutamate formiminotransferase